VGVLNKIDKVLGNKIVGTGIDVTDLVGKDLLDRSKGDYATIGAGADVEKQKPIIGATVKKGQVEAGIGVSSSTDLGLGAQYTSEDKSTTAGVGVSKNPQGKEIRFGITKRFKSGGSVEVGKGKDYIKDLI
jgi:hypothetical protein